jgi:hypothetical protein
MISAAVDVSAPRKSSRSNKGKIAKRKFDPCAAANASAMENAVLVERMHPNDSQGNKEACGLDNYSHYVFLANYRNSCCLCHIFNSATFIHV